MNALEYDRFLNVKKMLERNSSPMMKRTVLVKSIIKDDFHIIKYLAEEVGLDSIWCYPPSSEKEQIIGVILLNILHSGNTERQHEILRYFLEERGADPDGGHAGDYRAEDFKVLPIEMAITFRRNDLVELLLDYGASVRAEGVIRIVNRPMNLNDERLIDRLFLHINQDTLNKALTELTRFTYMEKYHEVAKLLIDYGADKTFICTEITGIKTSERSQLLITSRTHLREYIPVNSRRIYCGYTPVAPTKASAVG